MNNIKEQLEAMGNRILALESKNKELEKQIHALTCKIEYLVEKDGTYSASEELTSRELIKIKEMARDTQRYGYDAAMAMHGWPVAKRGRKSTSKASTTSSLIKK